MATEILFKQVNLHRAREASYQLNNLVSPSPSICLLQEPYTAFGRVANVPANHKCVPATQMISRPRTAIFIPKHMPYIHLEQLSNPDISVILLSTDRGKVLIASIYLDREKAVVQPWLQKLAEYIATKKYPTIIGVDSNAHSQLYGPDTNDRGERFEDFILQHNFRVDNRGETPTYHAFRRGRGIGTCIDVTLTKGVVPLCNWRVNDDLYNGSDHHTITWSLPLTLPPPISIRPWHSAKWDVFTKKLETYTFDAPQNFTTRKLDRFLNRVYKAIFESLDEACPMREAKATPLEIAWFGKDQRRFLNRTKRRYASYKKNKTRSKRKALIKAKRTYIRSCKQAKHASWREFVEKTPDEKSMARLVKIAQRRDTRTINTLMKDDGTLTEPGEETIQRLAAAHFPAAQLGTTEMVHNCKHKIRTSEIQDAFSDWIDPALIQKAAKRFLPYKAAGPDGLKPIVLKHLTPKVLEALTLIYKACIALKHTPKVWRDTKVIFLPKPGKTKYDIPKSYRPISLSNFLLKTLERLVVWKMDKDLEYAALHKSQHGFTKGKSTESAISNTIDYIEQQLFERSHCLGVFLDISSAFDSISIDHIRQSLLEHNGDPDLVEWYYSYLGRRHLQIELHGDTVHLTTGTGFPQGGVCSARFWLIAFDRAIQIINTRGITGTGYADDCSALIGGTHPDNMIESMQAMLDQLVAWGLSCGLRFNAQKTVAIMFTRATRSFDREVRMDGSLLPYSDQVVYLGVTLDSRLLWTEHILNKCKKVKGLLAKTAHLTAAYWGPRVKLLKWAYTGIARPVIAYAAMAWAHESETPTINDALRRVNRLAMNSMVRVPRSTPTRTMELALDLLPLDLFAIKIGLAAFCRLRGHLPMTWEGVFDNTTHAVSHLRFWDYTAQDLGVKESDPNIDECYIIAPELKFTLDLSSFVDMAGCQGQAECNVYTDGSKKGDKVGSGVYIMRPGQPPFEASVRLPDTSTVFQAEVLAIKEAAEILQGIPNLTTVKFFVDSQAALRSFHKAFITSKLVLQTAIELNNINASSVTFVWTKAHIGTDGNEHADRLAKIGTTLDDIRQVPKPATSDDALEEGIRERWEREWDLRHDCRQSKLFFPKPCKKTSNLVISWPRLKLGRYIRAITGHNNLLYHLHNMYPFISPNCRFCNDADEEFYHLAYMCPALWQERHYINSLDADHFNDWTAIQVVEFTLIPKINDAFVRPLYWVEDERELLETPTQIDDPAPSPQPSDSDASVMDATSIESSGTDDQTTDSDIIA